MELAATSHDGQNMSHVAEPPVPPAVNPWLALPSGHPSPALTRRLRAAHERLVTGAEPGDDAVRAVVQESWRRSLGRGVDPDDGTPPVDLLDDELIA